MGPKPPAPVGRAIKKTIGHTGDYQVVSALDVAGSEGREQPDGVQAVVAPARQPSELEEREEPTQRRTSIALNLLAFLAVIFALDWAQAFLVPVITGICIAYTLQPAVNFLERLQVPRTVGAALVLCLLIAGFGYTIASLRGDALAILEALPQTTHKLTDALVGWRGSRDGAMHSVDKVAQELDRASRAAQKPPDGAVIAQPPVVIASTAGSDLKSALWNTSLTAAGVFSTLTIALLLVFFLLQAGDSFRRKLVRVVGPTLSAKRITVAALNDINLQIQNYFWMLLVTNAVLALVSWAGYRAIGLNNAGVWGLTTGALHLIPYFGSLLAAAAAAAAALTQFGTLSMALAVAAIPLGLGTVIGMFVAPWMTGRLAKMNPTAIFIGLLFFGWIWGAWGMLLAIPIVVVVKVVAESVEALNPAAELLAE